MSEARQLRDQETERNLALLGSASLVGVARHGIALLARFASLRALLGAQRLMASPSVNGNRSLLLGIAGCRSVLGLGRCLTTLGARRLKSFCVAWLDPALLNRRHLSHFRASKLVRHSLRAPWLHAGSCSAKRPDEYLGFEKRAELEPEGCKLQD